MRLPALLSLCTAAALAQNSFPAGAQADAEINRAIEAGRFYGLRLEGVWMHVGTPDAIAAAEAAILASAA